MLVSIIALNFAAGTKADVHFAGTPARDLRVRFNDAANTEADLTEGAGDKVGLYSATDGAIATAGLSAGTYVGRIFDDNDELVGVIPQFYWSGTVELPAAANLVRLDGNTTAAQQLAEVFDNDATGGDMDVSALSVLGTSTFTGRVDLDNGIDVSSATTDQPAIKAVGNGSGAGFELVGGSSQGTGFDVKSGSGTTSFGMKVTSNTAYGGAVHLQGGSLGNGLSVLAGEEAIVAGSTGGSPSLALANDLLVNGATSFAGGISGDITGNITGNLTGNVTGTMLGLVPFYGQVSYVDSSTVYHFAYPQNSGDYNSFEGSDIIFYDVSNSNASSRRRIIDTQILSGVAIQVTVDAAPDFTVTTSDTAAIVYTNNSDIAVRGKLPSKSHLVGTNNSDGDVQIDEATGNYPGSVGFVAGNVDGDVAGSVGSVSGDVGGDVVGSVGSVAGSVGGLATGALADLFDTNSGKVYSNAVAGSVVKEIADHATTPSLTATGIADEVLDALVDSRPSGSLGKTVGDVFNLLNDAPTFAQAMDDQGYTMDLAEKLDGAAATSLLSTTIDGPPASATTFVVTEGPTADHALQGSLVIVTDSGDPSNKTVGLVKDYDEGTSTVTLVAEPGVFELGDGDRVDFIASGIPLPLWLLAP
ncbi:MAG: hypothetical protein AB7G28_25680 [Pirellulales bacterium]